MNDITQRIRNIEWWKAPGGDYKIGLKAFNIDELMALWLAFKIRIKINNEKINRVLLCILNAIVLMLSSLARNHTQYLGEFLFGFTEKENKLLFEILECLGIAGAVSFIVSIVLGGIYLWANSNIEKQSRIIRELISEIETLEKDMTK